MTTPVTLPIEWLPECRTCCYKRMYKREGREHLECEVWLDPSRARRSGRMGGKKCCRAHSEPRWESRMGQKKAALKEFAELVGLLPPEEKPKSRGAPSKVRIISMSNTHFYARPVIFPQFAEESLDISIESDRIEVSDE